MVVRQATMVRIYPQLDDCDSNDIAGERLTKVQPDLHAEAVSGLLEHLHGGTTLELSHQLTSAICYLKEFRSDRRPTAHVSLSRHSDCQLMGRDFLL